MEAITDVDLAYAEFERLIKQEDPKGMINDQSMPLWEKQDIYNGPSADYILRIRQAIAQRETWDLLPEFIHNSDAMGLITHNMHPHSVRAFIIACNGGPRHLLKLVKTEESWPAWAWYIKHM